MGAAALVLVPVEPAAVRGIDAAVIATLARKALGAFFPRVRFSVRTDRFSQGCAVRVSWTDGPTAPEVSAALDAAGLSAWNDGRMHFLTTTREHSPALIARAAARAAFGSDSPAWLDRDTAIYRIARRMNGAGCLVDMKGDR